MFSKHFGTIQYNAYKSKQDENFIINKMTYVRYIINLFYIFNNTYILCIHTYISLRKNSCKDTLKCYQSFSLGGGILSGFFSSYCFSVDSGSHTSLEICQEEKNMVASRHKLDVDMCDDDTSNSKIIN